MRPLIAIVLAGLAGCASDNVVDRINMVCARIENHTVESNGDCTVCYAEGQTAVACIMESD